MSGATTLLRTGLTEIVDEDKIYLTSESGTIEFTTDGERLWVEVGR